MTSVPAPGRRALTHVGGGITTAGDPADADRLAHALDVAPATDAPDDPARAHVHGFHTYPARLHPITAGRLVRAFVPPGGRVLDPFCGSGTVPVEALLAGRRAVGADLNPIAVLLAGAKSRPRAGAELDRLVTRAHAAADRADARRHAKAGALRRFAPADVSLYEPHVLLELDSLLAGVDAPPDEPARADLALVLSSILIKLSRRRADTAAGVAGRKTAPGFASRLFAGRAEEWADRLAAFARLVPTPPPAPGVVVVDDATGLRNLPPGPVDAVVTSPPYAGTYDYLDHHEVRLRWLGYDEGPLARGELGARSAYQRIPPADAPRLWADELGRFLRAVAPVVRPGGPVVLVVADSAVGDVALRADRIVADVARGWGFVPAARASQDRPHFHAGTAAAFRWRPRAEHAILLRRV